MFKKICLVFLSFTIITIFSCKSPVGPEPVIEYKSEVLVTYTRPELNCPGCALRASIYLIADLYDPNDEDFVREEGVAMEKVGTDDQGRAVYEATLYRVFIQTAEHSKKHEFKVEDPQIYDGTPNSRITGKIIHVQGEYEREVYDELMKCKIK